MAMWFHGGQEVYQLQSLVGGAVDPCCAPRNARRAKSSRSARCQPRRGRYHRHQEAHEYRRLGTGPEISAVSWEVATYGRTVEEQQTVHDSSQGPSRWRQFLVTRRLSRGKAETWSAGAHRPRRPTPTSSCSKCTGDVGLITDRASRATHHGVHRQQLERLAGLHRHILRPPTTWRHRSRGL